MRHRTLAALALVLGGCTPSPTAGVIPVSAAAELPATCNGLALTSVRAGWDALDRGDRELALRMFEKASRSDSGCILATAHRGALTSGPEGKSLVDEARRRGRALGLAEQLQIELLASVREGDAAAALTAQERLAAAFPSSWRAQHLYGRRLASFQRYDEAEAVLERATELAPDRPAPFELLGWTRLELRKDPSRALTPIMRWAELSPLDAKAHRFLGVSLALNSRFPEAEAALRKSLELDSRTDTWDRLTWVLALSEDEKKLGETLDAWRKAEPIEANRRADAHLAWSLLQRGEVDSAVSTLEEMERIAAENEGALDRLAARMTRGVVLSLAGRHVEALRVLDEAEALNATTPLPADECGASLRTMWLRARIHAEARGDRPDLAQRTLEEIRALPPRFSRREQLIAFAEGELLRRAAEPRKADERFAACEPFDSWCAAQRIELAEALGETDRADALRTSMWGRVREDPLYPYFRARNRPPMRNR